MHGGPSDQAELCGRALAQDPDALAAVQNARLSPSDGFWPYRLALEERVQNVAARMAAFARRDPAQYPESMVESRFACTGCHAR